MATLADLQTELPEWVQGIASQLDKKETKKLNRALAVELRILNRERVRKQVDPNGKRFIRPLQAKNSPMFKTLVKPKYLKFKATARLAQTGFSGNAARIAQVHHEGKRDTVRQDSSKKYPYPERQLLGVSTKDRHKIVEIIREQLTAQ